MYFCISHNTATDGIARMFILVFSRKVFSTVERMVVITKWYLAKPFSYSQNGISPIHCKSVPTYIPHSESTFTLCNHHNYNSILITMCLLC